MTYDSKQALEDETDAERRAAELLADAEQEAAELLAKAERQAAELLADAERQAAELLANAEQQAAELSADAERQASELLAAEQKAAELSADVERRASELLAAEQPAAGLLADIEQQVAELSADAEQQAAELLATAKEPAAELVAAAKQRAAELVAAAKQQAAELMAAAKQQAAERLASAKQQAAELLTAAAQQTADRISALRQGEEEVMEAQKMEAVGQLASGIAHDFNNLLTVISGYTEILIEREGKEASKELTEIRSAVARAAQLTRQLLAYSRHQVLMPTTLDLNHVVTETKGMLERLIGTNIEFSVALSEDLAHISADVGQLEQIVVNLVVNARDAMPDGGTLLLETANFTVADTQARPDMSPGDYVMLALTDDGSGMDAETIERIFEPFYTTKERGVGTGLGLATVFGIVMQSSGHVEVESKPGVGTSFRIYFPQVPAEVEAEELVPDSSSERALTGSETILVVEDEGALRDLAKVVLESFGYTVLLGSNGHEGLELAQDHPDPIHLLMADILMPKMDGKELAQRLSTARPGIKVLYTSGYYDGEERMSMVAGARYLQKPYTINELAHTLRELLDEALN